MLRTARALRSLQHPVAAALTAVGISLGAPFAALAQMIPLDEQRSTLAHIRYLGMEQQQGESPTAPFGNFVSTISLEQPNPDPDGGGSCSAFTTQISEFTPSYISMFGTTSGSWNVHPGSYDILSASKFWFRVDTCVEIQLDGWLDGGDLLSPMWLRVHAPAVDAYLFDLAPNSEVHHTGRLGPGLYTVEAASYLWSIEQETAQGATYSVLWTCVPCTASLIRDHPDSTTVGCGGTASFNVTPSGTGAGMTYQWRRNFTPISSGGRISGATSPTLVISSACEPDTGYYDVVLSDGTIIEPSGLARLRVATETGVEIQPVIARDFSIEMAGPNPFAGRASFRYAAAGPKRARIAIYNAAGALVRMLADGVLTGSGVLEWNGATTGGSQAPAGVYFLRAETEMARETRKIVLLR